MSCPSEWQPFVILLDREVQSGPCLLGQRTISDHSRCLCDLGQIETSGTYKRLKPRERIQHPRQSQTNDPQDCKSIHCDSIIRQNSCISIVETKPEYSSQMHNYGQSNTPLDNGIAILGYASGSDSEDESASDPVISGRIETPERTQA